MKLFIILFILLLPSILSPSENFVIYSIYHQIPMGVHGEVLERDLFINMGTSNGVKKGSTLEVIRQVTTYDLSRKKSYKDLTFPIAELNVIHSEPHASIARVKKMLPLKETPILLPNSVMIGDTVRKKK